MATLSKNHSVSEDPEETLTRHEYLLVPGEVFQEPEVPRQNREEQLRRQGALKGRSCSCNDFLLFPLTENDFLLLLATGCSPDPLLFPSRTDARTARRMNERRHWGAFKEIKNSQVQRVHPRLSKPERCVSDDGLKSNTHTHARALT